MVRVRYGDEENTPQAADTYFPYTLPYNSGKKLLNKASSDIDSPPSPYSLDSLMELTNDKSVPITLTSNN